MARSSAIFHGISVKQAVTPFRDERLSRASRRSIGTWGAGFLLGMMLTLIVLRGLVLLHIAQGLADCTWCMAATAMQQDCALIALLLGLMGCSFFTRRYWLQLPFLVLGALLVLIVALDVVLMQTLAQRLYLFDVLKFGKELSAIGEFANFYLASAAGKIALVTTLVLVTVCILACLPRRRSPTLAATCLAAAILLALFSRWQPITMQYIHYELLQNVIATNLDLGVDKPYSAAFAAQLAQRYVAPDVVCTPQPSQHPNVIIVAVESLSMHHSALFGHGRDLTPRLDAIARANIYFPDFIANGFTTDGGLIAMITGRAPVPAVGRYQSAEAFAGFESPKGALPDLLRPQGYTTHFFTTGDLGFLDKPRWLKGLHFDSWEGAEAKFYDGWKRRHFNAAEDKALYLRFLQWLDAHDSAAPQPWLAFMLTVSTHPPFINPQTDLPDEPGAFRYADAQLGMLYDELRKRDFFHNGILLISGDHRSMTPLLKSEQDQFGDSALARTPFVMVTDLNFPKGPVMEKFSQADIPPSLADLTSGNGCLTDAQGSFLRSPRKPAAYAIHARGDKRNLIDVYFGAAQGEIALDGDNTRWLGPKPADWQQIMDGITLDRIARGPVTQNALDLMIAIGTANATTPASK